MGIYGEHAHRLIEAQQSPNIVVTEGVKEVFDKIVTAVKNFIKKIIDFIKKLLGMKPNEKNKKDLNDNLDKAEKMYEDIKDTKDPEEVKEMKKKAEDLNKSTENIAKEMKSESGSEGFEYNKFEYDKFDYQKFYQDSMDEMEEHFDQIEKDVKEMRKDPENAKFLDDLADILNS